MYVAAACSADAADLSDTIYFMNRRFDLLFVPDDLHWYLLFISLWQLVNFDLSLTFTEDEFACGGSFFVDYADIYDQCVILKGKEAPSFSCGGI